MVTPPKTNAQHDQSIGKYQNTATRFCVRFNKATGSFDEVMSSSELKVSENFKKEVLPKI